MNNRQIGLWAKAAAGLLTALIACGASAEQAFVYTYQGQALTTEFTDDSRTGPRYTPIDAPGIAFSIMVSAPLQAGQTVSLHNMDLFHDNELFPGAANAENDTRDNTFTGVMGQNGSFETWDFTSDTVYSNISDHSTHSTAKTSDWQYASIVDWMRYNLNTPGVWTQRVVSINADNASRLNSVYRVDWVSPVPEADAMLMAVLGVVAVGALARRKALTI
jgi:hypothetical protein